LRAVAAVNVQRGQFRSNFAAARQRQMSCHKLYNDVDHRLGGKAEGEGYCLKLSRRLGAISGVGQIENC
jgi:hypothetical protein